MIRKLPQIVGHAEVEDLALYGQEAHMRKSKYSGRQIVSILREAEAGQPVKAVCRQYGISSACY